MSDVGRLGTILQDEHRRTLEAMNDLETRIMGPSKDVPIDVGDAQDGLLIGDLLAVLDTDIDRHFRFEEEELFPVLETRGLGELTAALTQEHQAVRPLADALRSSLEDARKGPLTPEEWQALREAAMDLIHSVLFHIQKEEMGLIRRLGFLLKDDIDARLATGYTDAGA